MPLPSSNLSQSLAPLRYIGEGGKGKSLAEADGDGYLEADWGLTVIGTQGESSEFSLGSITTAELNFKGYRESAECLEENKLGGKLGHVTDR